MNTDSLAPEPSPSLDRHGAASRCLLHLWENQGRPTLTDREFLQRHAARFPRWTTHPGELDAVTLGQLAPDFGYLPDMTTTQDYDETLRAHRAGRDVIVLTQCAPVQEMQTGAVRPHALVLEAMDEEGFTAWCPFASGASAVLERVEKIWWPRWSATACLLETAPPAPAKS